VTPRGKVWANVSHAAAINPSRRRLIADPVEQPGRVSLGTRKQEFGAG